MRRSVVLTALALGLSVLALGTTAGALPGVSVNRAPVSVNRSVRHSPVGAVQQRLPGAGNGNAQADRRQETRRRRAALVARWQGVAECESGGNWSTDTGNGYYGGLQFSMQTWQAYGGRGMPQDQPAWYQSGIAERVRHDTGLGAWPNCGQYYRA